MKKPLFFLLLALAGCAVIPPKNSDNICSTFREKEDWYGNANAAYQKWGVPVPVLMAIMHQESHFVADAKPPRVWLLGLIPWFRQNSAYGYAQALDATWDDYLDSVGRWGADRDDFADATDFIGWYNYLSNKRLGIAKTDAKNLYLAYHEGHNGYRKKRYLQKKWLMQVAAAVAKRAALFHKQLAVCQLADKR